MKEKCRPNVMQRRPKSDKYTQNKKSVLVKKKPIYKKQGK